MQGLLGLKPVAVLAEVQGAQLLAGLADEVGFADEDLVGLCGLACYADMTMAAPSSGHAMGWCSA
jgi:hypothetical protein